MRFSPCTLSPPFCFSFFFFNDTATTEIYTLSLHDALPIFPGRPRDLEGHVAAGLRASGGHRDGRSAQGHGGSRAARRGHEDRKSTRLNSSHGYISYAVFCLKKKKKQETIWIFAAPTRTRGD